MYLIISCVFPPEPVVSAKISYELGNELSKHSKIIVFSPMASRPKGFDFTREISLPINVRHIIANSFIYAGSSVFGRFWESISFGLASYRFIQHTKSDIEVIYLNTWPLFGQLFAVIAAKQYSIPVVLHVQDIYPESIISKLPKVKVFLNRLFLPMDRWILNNVNCVVAISERMKRYLMVSRGLKDGTVHVINNWQNLAPSFVFPKKVSPYAMTKDCFTFMYLGNIGPVAGCELLIEAFKAISVNGVRLVIAGAGSSRQNLVDIVEVNNLSNIEFWSVPDGEVFNIQNLADVLLLPIKKGSSLTSIPSKLPAYMFSSKPILAIVDSDCDTADSVEQADCGWVIEPDNPEFLSNKMIEILSETEDSLIMKGNNGYKYAYEHFHPEKQLKKLATLIRYHARIED